MCSSGNTDTNPESAGVSFNYYFSNTRKYTRCLTKIKGSEYPCPTGVQYKCHMATINDGHKEPKIKLEEGGGERGRIRVMYKS